MIFLRIYFISSHNKCKKIGINCNFRILKKKNIVGL